MEVKEAVGIAKRWLVDVLQDEDIANVGLEEVEFDDGQNQWNITLGFSRPWNTVKDMRTVITGEAAQRRAYRVITVGDSDGQVVSMKKRQEIDA